MIPVVSTQFIGPASTLVQGLFLGFLVGFLFQKGRLSVFNVIVGQFLFRSFVMLKILLTAIVVAGVTMQLLLYSGFIAAIPANTVLLSRALVGGGIMGAGMALLGYCPGSCLAAVGQGSRDALFGLLGFFCGGALLNLVFPRLMVYFTGVEKPLFLNAFWGISPFWLFLGFSVGVLGLFWLLERSER